MRKNCPNCGERFEGDVCPKCGTAVSRKINRKASANKLAEDAAADKFLTDEQRAAAQAQLANRKKDRSFLIFLIIIRQYLFYKQMLIDKSRHKNN